MSNRATLIVVIAVFLLSACALVIADRLDARANRLATERARLEKMQR